MPVPFLPRKIASAVAVAVAAYGSIVQAQIPVTWTQGAIANWNATANWTGLQGGDLFPNNAGGRTYTVTIAGTAGQVGTTSVTFNTSTGAPANTITLNGLALAPVLDVSGNPAAELVLGAGVTLNAGNLSNFSGSTLSGGRYFIDGTLQFTGANIQTLAAGTTLIFNNAAAKIVNQTNVNALTNFINNQGVFDIRNSFNFTTATGFQNSGVVSVSEGSNFATTGTFTNTGLLLASGVAGTGGINITSTTFNNAGGTVTAGNNGVVFMNGSSINGGTLTSTGNGRVFFSNSSSNFADNVTVGGTLDLATSVATMRNTSGLTLSSGTINIDNGSNLTFQGSQTVGGTGEIVFGSNTSNRVAIDASNSNITLGSGVTIHGMNGSVGAQLFVGSGGTMLTNNGKISADVNGGTIALAQATFANNNILEAKNGGTLAIMTAVNNSATGQINANSNGMILLNGTTVTGGTVNTTTGGRLVASNSGANFLNDATLNGKIDLATATGQLRVNGTTGLTMMSGSTINIDQASIFEFQGTQTLGGTGKVIFGSAASNRLSLDASNSILTIGSGVQIRGQNGSIGAQVYIGSGGTSIVNNGRISADVATGVIDISQATVTNNGILEAQNGGTLSLSSNVTGGVGSQILAGAGSTVVQNGITISGIINSNGSGSFRPSNSSTNFLDAVTLTGTIDLGSALAQERVINGLVLNGNINVNAGNVIAFQGTQTISGNGNIILGGTASSNRVAIDASNTALTIGSGVHIRGENGVIGQQNFIGSGGTSIINNGHISADVNGGTLEIGQATVTNNGILEAQNGGRLVLSSNVAGTPLGQILAGANSVVQQNNITMSGIVNASGNGVLRSTTGSSNFFDGVTLNGNLDLTTPGVERVINGLVLNGNIGINQGSVLAFQGSQTLSGTGTITFGNTVSGNKVAIDASNTELIVASGVLIHGENGVIGAQHFIGSGGTILTNNGRISADVSGGTLTLQQALFQNNGTIEGVNGGNIDLFANVNQTSTGVLKAANSSIVRMNGNTVTGGTITTNTGGTFVATNSSTNFLNDVALNGKLDLATNVGSVRVNGSTGITMQAGSTIDLNKNSVLSFTGTQTLGGTGTVSFGSDASNKIAIDGSNSSLTIGSGVLVHGVNASIGDQHFIGTGNSHLINNGTINSDGGGLITIGSGSNADNVNNGTLRAQNGTLTLNKIINGTGTLQVDAAGVLNMSSTGPNTQDKLFIGATGSALNTANQNITINKDYTNTSAGTGNAFSKRASVNGTGQINAGGNAAQAITGTQVTNGNTTNATLTIGNVRVGTTNFNYQIANTGTVGADLRGALQTSVNGANISDARLSGAGVTAANYGPVAVATNAGNLAVAFNAATAGALSPLSGQAINLRSNFDNIADQKLNIALAAGAAAYNAATGSAAPSPTNLGNTRINGTLAGNLTVTNTAPVSAFTEKLDASFAAGANTGSAGNNGGTINLLMAGTSNNSSMGVSLNTSSSGAKTGTVTLNYVTDGTGTSSLANATAGSQAITVNGNVYQTAVGTLNSTPLNFGTVQVGQSVSKTLSITNSATGSAGFVEDLNASFGVKAGTGTSLFSGSGSISGLTAGSTNTNAMTVSVNTAAAGSVNGTISVDYLSAGAVGGFSNGLGTLAVGNSLFGVQGDITASANVVNQASPVINNAPINLGNVRINSSSPSAFVNITNQATTAPQAALNASITGNGGITGSGSFNLLNPGATNNNSLLVAMNTSTAGLKNNNATISLVSDASNIGNCSSNCQMNLPSQNVTVNGAVFRFANPTIAGAPVNLAARVADAAPTASLTITNTSPDIYTEALNATFVGAAPTGFTTTGSITGLAAQGSSTAMKVGLNTTTAGTFGGSAGINLISSGAGTTGAADFALAQGSANLNGKVYTAAIAQVIPTTVNFGTVHVGDVLSPIGLSVKNNAAVTLLNDVLTGDITGGNAQFNVTGNLGAGVAAGVTNSTSLKVAFNTTNAGVFSSSAAVNLKSHDADLTDLSLGSTPLQLNGTVNNYATAAFMKSSGFGLFTQVAGGYKLDFGSILKGTSGIFAALGVQNTANGPADVLGGSFLSGSGTAFALSGFSAFSNIGAGSLFSPLGITFNASALGSFTRTITLNSFGSNSSGYNANLADIQLTLAGTVVAVEVPPTTSAPEPGSMALVAAGLVAVMYARKRRLNKPSV